MKRCKECNQPVLSGPNKSIPFKMIPTIKNEGSPNERIELEPCWESEALSPYCYYHDKKARGLL